MRIGIAILALFTLATGASAQQADKPHVGGDEKAAAAPGAENFATARVVMRGADGKELGTLDVRDTHAGLLIEASLRGLPPGGTHAFHVHAVGRCEAPFESAGPHLDSKGHDHGFLADKGPHGGDLVNIQVAADGSVKQVLRAPDLAIKDLRDTDGAAFILHASADDYASQPAGNSGNRIACGVVEVSGTSAQP